MAGYGDDGAFTAWLSENGYTLPGSAPAPAILRLRGSQYIDATYGARFSGTPTGGIDQPRAWPRTGATAYGNPIGPDGIPGAVVISSYHAAWLEAQSPGSLSVVATENERLKRMKAGSVELEYADGSGTAIAGAVPMSSAIEGMLAPLLVSSRPLPAVLVV